MEIVAEFISNRHLHQGERRPGRSKRIADLKHMRRLSPASRVGSLCTDANLLHSAQADSIASSKDQCLEFWRQAGEKTYVVGDPVRLGFEPAPECFVI